MNIHDTQQQAVMGPVEIEERRPVAVYLQYV